MKSLISIIIRTKNEAVPLQLLLESLETQQNAPELEAIIVDNLSTDDTLEVAKRCNLVKKVVEIKDFNYGRALNLGVAAAKGDYILSLSAHALPASDLFLAGLLTCLTSSQAVAVSAKEIPFANAPIWEKIRLTKIWQSTHRPFSNVAALYLGSYLRDHLFLELPYSEDSAWAAAARLDEKNVTYCDGAQIFHSHLESAQEIKSRFQKIYLAERQLRTCPKSNLGRVTLGFLKDTIRDTPYLKNYSRNLEGALVNFWNLLRFNYWKRQAQFRG
ncbi:MAG: glycosyltransferase [candidate division WWE3 bacterium]|nr:glycosyltransferase [candidate division WWE3 bacterium]